MAPPFASRVGLLVALTSVAPSALHAQNQITPGQPTQPFVGQAALNNPQVTYSYGIEFVTVNAAGNAPLAAPPGVSYGRANGRGGVDHNFRIARYEITSLQWSQFLNAAGYAAATSGQSIPFIEQPSFWGGYRATSNPYGQGVGYAVLPGNEYRMVGNLSWRALAVYCNWLHNNQALTRDAFLSGAYDTSTFSYTGPNGDRFTDQAAHSPGARYWIPTWDEYLTASHYDPNRNGPGQGGWWLYNNSHDTPAAAGMPASMGGSGEANYGFSTGTFSEFAIPLGAYPNTQSPWGLFDLAGGTSEWTEEVVDFGTFQYNSRIFEGSYASSSAGYYLADSPRAYGSDFPSYSPYFLGGRIAASVPSPAGLSGVIMIMVIVSRRERIKHLHGK